MSRKVLKILLILTSFLVANKGMAHIEYDHLGNVRSVVNESGEVLQYTHYYPNGNIIPALSTSSSFQPYKYNGKELDKMHGLDWYDYGARNYDAVLSRWDRINPLAEKYYHISPYGYCAGNPMNAIDINGCDTIKIDYINNKWVISEPIIAKGYDVFIVNGIPQDPIVEGEHGNRMNMINLSENDYETLGVYQLSGTSTVGYTLQRSSSIKASVKRIPEGQYDTYIGKGPLWYNYIGLRGKGASAGIRVHYGEYVGWSQGCVILSSDYKLINGKVQFDLDESRDAVFEYVKYLGAKNKRTLNFPMPSPKDPNRTRDMYDYIPNPRANNSKVIIQKLKQP